MKLLAPAAASAPAFADAAGWAVRWQAGNCWERAWAEQCRQVADRLGRAGLFAPRGDEVYLQSCFTGDTPQWAPGESEQIDQIKAGDCVLSRNGDDRRGAGSAPTQPNEHFLDDLRFCRSERAESCVPRRSTRAM
jgi:hypothetical protein